MPPDPWAITLSQDAPPVAGDARSPAHLIRLVSCDRPDLPSSRHVLDGIAAVVVGRAVTAEVRRRDGELALGVSDRRLSSRHFELRREGPGWIVRDLESKNGTAVDGEPVRDQVLGDGDLIEAGGTFFLFRARVPTPPDEPLDVDAGEVRGLTRELATFSPTWARSLAQLARVATSPAHILVLGPSGAGKELIARAIHALSARSGPFVPVNCGALPDTLVEAELFGSVKGAFSGATTDRPGFLRSAQGGTLFLDEIGDLRLSSQPPLLRVLQEREVVPVGASRAVPLDIQVVSATHRDVPAMVAAGLFREDLAARLSGFGIAVPALARRREDLGILIASLLARLAPGREVTFTTAAMRRLLLHAWPTNVRELENCLVSALALAPDLRIDVDALPERLQPRAAQPERSDAELRIRDQLLELLREHAGNVSAMARASGWTRMQVHRRLKRFDLDLESFRRRK
jgi:transcriptional regulator with AAA-type ATPase domain